MRTANPALSKKTFEPFVLQPAAEAAMTIQGVVNKSFFLLLIVFLAAGYPWRQYFHSWDPSGVGRYIAIGGIGGFIAGLVTIFNQRVARFTAPLYAALEGLFLGGISAYLESAFPGVVIQAVALTFGTALSLLVLYKSGRIPVDQNFRLGVMSATGAVFLVYLLTMIFRLFGLDLPFIHQGGLVGIGFSLVVVVIAALNLVLDFDFIEQGAAAGAPRYMEWYSAFGLLVTLVWLYLEILRLLVKLRQRN